MFWDDGWARPGATLDLMTVVPQESGGWRGYLRERCEVVDASFARVGGGRELSRLVVRVAGDPEHQSGMTYGDDEIAELLHDLGHEESVGRFLLVRKQIFESWRYYEAVSTSTCYVSHTAVFTLSPVGSRPSTLDYYLETGVLR